MLRGVHLEYYVNNGVIVSFYVSCEALLMLRIDAKSTAFN